MAEKHIALLDEIFEEKLNIGYTAVKEEFLDKILGVVGKDILYGLKDSSIAITTLYLLETEYTQEFPSSPVWIEEEFKTKQFRKAFTDAKIRIKESIMDPELEKDKVLEVLEKIQKMQREMNKMYEEIKEMYAGKERASEKKEKRGMSDMVGSLTQEDWKRQPKTIRDFLEQLHIKDVDRTLRITDKEREARFIITLKALERYFPSYTPENKERASDCLSKMLTRPDIEKREEIQKRIKVLIDQAKQK